MLLLTLAVASAAISSPQFINGADIVTPDDYPAQMLKDDRSAFEDVRVVVTPLGKTERCDVIGEIRVRTNAVVDKIFKDLSCSLMVRRAKFRPATGIDGQPSYGTLSAWISWQTGDGPFYTSPDQVDAEISVASLPKGVIDPALIDVDVAVDADGTPAACIAAPMGKPAAPRQVISPALAEVACAQFTASGKLNPAHTQAGVAVASVQRLVARFTAAKAPVVPPLAGK